MPKGAPEGYRRSGATGGGSMGARGGGGRGGGKSSGSKPLMPKGSSFRKTPKPSQSLLNRSSRKARRRSMGPASQQKPPQKPTPQKPTTVKTDRSGAKGAAVGAGAAALMGATGLLLTKAAGEKKGTTKKPATGSNGMPPRPWIKGTVAIVGGRRAKFDGSQWRAL